MMSKIIQTLWWQKPDEAMEYFKRSNPHIHMSAEEEEKMLNTLEIVWENNKDYAVEMGYQKNTEYKRSPGK